jgi:hypothetical protein
MPDIPMPQELIKQVLGYVPEWTPETWEEVHQRLIEYGYTLIWFPGNEFPFPVKIPPKQE